MTAEIVARRSTGTRSGRIAASAATVAFSAAAPRHHQTSNSRKVPARDTGIRSSAVTTAPPTIHGVREPNRDRVRSDSAPKTTLASSATTAAAPVRTASRATLSSGYCSAMRAGSRTVEAALYGRT